MPPLNRDQAREALQASLAHYAPSQYDMVQEAAARRARSDPDRMPYPSEFAARIVAEAGGNAREAYHYLDVLNAAVGVALNDYKRGT